MFSRRASTIAVLSVVYIDMLGIGLAYPILPKLIQQFEHGDVSHASYIFGLLAGAYALMQFIFSPLLGALSDRFGRRPVILLALIGMGINYIMMALAPNLIWLAAGRMIAGAMGATFTAAGAYLADITPPEKRAQTFGLIGTAFGFGFITGPALGGVLGAIDLRLPFIVAAILSFADLVFGYFAMPESLAPENRKAFSPKSSHPIGAVRAIGKYPGVLALLTIFVMAQFANRVGEMTWVLFTAYRFHWTPVETGISLAMVGVMFIVGQGVMTRLVIPRLGERQTILTGLSVSIIVVILYGTVRHGWMIYPAMALAIFGWTVAAPAVQGLMSRAVPANEQGLLQGALASMNNLTSIAGPPIWTGLFGYFISPAAPLIIPGAAFYVAALVFFAALMLAYRWLSAIHAAPQPAETATA